MKINILIADDNIDERRNLKTRLSGGPEIEIIDEAVDGTNVVEFTQKHLPDVVLMDVSMAGKTDCLSAISMIRKLLPGTEVIAITSVLESSAVVSALEAGAIGYVLKDATAKQFWAAVHAAAAGRQQLPFGANGRLIYERRKIEDKPPISFWSQSPFEHAVLRIHKEHDLFNNRLTWLLTSQIALFTAYGLFKGNADPVKANSDPAIASLILALPLIGFISCAVVYSSILGALVAIHYWRGLFWKRTGKGSVFSLVGPDSGHALGLIAPIFLPLVFASIWAFLLTHGDPTAVWVILLFGVGVFVVYFISDILRFLGFEDSYMKK